MPALEPKIGWVNRVLLSGTLIHQKFHSGPYAAIRREAGEGCTQTHAAHWLEGALSNIPEGTEVTISIEYTETVSPG